MIEKEVEQYKKYKRIIMLFEQMNDQGLSGDLTFSLHCGQISAKVKVCYCERLEKMDTLVIS